MSPSELSKQDREYLVEGCWPYRYTPPEGRQAELDAFEIVEGEHELCMDSHGVVVCLCVYREQPGGPLLAFRWGYSSEERFFDYYADNASFEVEQHAEVRTVYSYTTPDGEEVDV